MICLSKHNNDFFFIKCHLFESGIKMRIYPFSIKCLVIVVLFDIVVFKHFRNDNENVFNLDLI